MKRTVVRTVILSVLATLAVLGAATLLWMYSGEYNVAASAPHTALERWALETVMERSVKEHAAGIPVPSLSDSSLIADGFHHFREMCVTCHGAPGRDPSEIGKGLTPDPPELSEVVDDWKESELFWILKHGIKMSGMPAFGSTHKDRELWGIVAFLTRLPNISPEEYRALDRAQEEGGEGHSHGTGGERTSGSGQGHSAESAAHEHGNGHESGHR